MDLRQLLNWNIIVLRIQFQSRSSSVGLLVVAGGGYGDSGRACFAFELDVVIIFSLSVHGRTSL